MVENRLFDAISCQQWDEVHTLISTDEGLSLTKLADENNRLPLHNIFNYKRAPSCLILNLIKRNEEAAKISDSDNLLPLHHASYWGASPAVIELLIRIYPYALDTPNTFGDTPRDLIKIGSLDKQSSSLIKKTTGYWVEMVEMESRADKLTDFVTQGKFLLSAKSLASKIADELEELSRSKFFLRNVDSEEKKSDECDNDAEYSRWAFLKAKTDLTFERLSKVSVSLLKELELSPRFDRRQDKLTEFEVRLAALEDAYNRVNCQLDQSNLDCRVAIENQQAMQQKLEETESVLEITLTELTALRSLYDVQANNLAEQEQENMQQMEKKIAKLERSMQQAAVEMEEGKLANIEIAFNNKEVQRKMEETKSDVDCVVEQFATCKNSCDESVACVKKNEKACSTLETSLRTFIQEQKNCRIDFRVGNLELAFQNAIQGVEKNTKSTQELKQNGSKLQESVNECVSAMTNTNDTIKAQSQFIKEHSARLKEIDESLRSVDSRLTKISAHEKEIDESIVKVNDRLVNHDHKFSSSHSEFQILIGKTDDLRVALDCNNKSFDEKLSITSKIVTDAVTASFEEEIKIIKNKISDIESKNHLDAEEVKNDLVVIEAEWAAKHELIEKDITSVTAKLFDGEDWDTL